MAAALKTAAVTSETRATPRFDLFTRLWGVAMAAHVIGNVSQPDVPQLLGWVNLGVGLAGVLLVVRPRRVGLMIGSVLVVLSVILEMPFTGNHWLVAGLVSLSFLVARGRSETFLPAARWILIVFYLFAAVAKWNSAFFDPTVSCAVFYANQSLNAFGLNSLSASSMLATATIWATVMIEASVPVLLVIRRTRYWGALVGTAFHTLISFDLGQHFYDFTSVLVALFFLFLPEESVKRLAERGHLVSPKVRSLAAASWLVLGTTLVIMASGPLDEISFTLLKVVPFVLWIPFCLVWLWQIIGTQAKGDRVLARLRPATGLVVLIAVLNGLTPYTEIKTAYSFNMYANLLTADGESNHLIIVDTIPLRDGYRDPVEIVESSDPGLELYRDTGFLLAYPQLRRYLSDRIDASLTYRRGSEVFSLDRVGDDPELIDPGPWWWRFLPLRAIDTSSPPRCQDVFLPAL